MKLEPGVWKETDGRPNCWRVRFTYKGHTLEDSFAKAADANKFVRDNKASIDATGRPANIRELRDTKLKHVFQARIDYIEKRMPNGAHLFAARWNKDIEMYKRLRKETTGYKTDLRTLEMAIEDPMFDHHVLTFKRKHVKEYIEKRQHDIWQGPHGRWAEANARPIKTKTIAREIVVFHKAYELLRDEYDHLVNPFGKIGRIEGKQPSFEGRRLEIG